jgi:hypothetical protein
MTRFASVTLLALALAGLATPGRASIPTALPLAADVTAIEGRGYATADATGLVRPADGVATAREDEPPAPRKICPTRSWPNLAPRCVADLGATR